MGVPSAELASELIATVSRELPVTPDGWAPSVQGAVGHVLGVRGADGTGYVLKTYQAEAYERSGVEVLALGLLGPVPGVPVPEVLLVGHLDGDAPLAYVLLSRLPGVRWADRRDALTASESAALLDAVGRLLRLLHAVPGRRYGSVLRDGPSWPTAWERVSARCDELLDRHLALGGPPELAGRVRALVASSRSAIDSCERPVLCHNDFNGGNLLVTTTGAPAVCGVVDLERASFDDPLSDLALTRLHLWHHDPDDDGALLAAYGVHSPHERRRVDVYEVLLAVQERSWIWHDRPAGWVASVAALDAFLRERT